VLQFPDVPGCSPVERGTAHNVARQCNFIKRSRKHFVKTQNDLIKLVNQLLQEDTLTETPGGRYKQFKGFPQITPEKLANGEVVPVDKQAQI